MTIRWKKLETLASLCETATAPSNVPIDRRRFLTLTAACAASATGLAMIPSAAFARVDRSQIKAKERYRFGRAIGGLIGLGGRFNPG